MFFLCLVGWILARRGIVDDKAKKVRFVASHAGSLARPRPARRLRTRLNKEKVDNRMG